MYATVYQVINITIHPSISHSLYSSHFTLSLSHSPSLHIHPSIINHTITFSAPTEERRLATPATIPIQPGLLLLRALTPTHKAALPTLPTVSVLPGHLIRCVLADTVSLVFGAFHALTVDEFVVF